MALTFPVDTTEVDSIPALEVLAADYPGHHGLIRFCCYRFDPKCDEVRKRQTVAEKNELAAALSGYKPRAEIDDAALQSIATGILRLVNSLDWEVMCSLEIALDESMQMIREPIISGDEDKRLKAVELKQKVIGGMGKIEAELVNKRHKIAEADEQALSAINAGMADRRMKRNTLTGRMEEAE